MSDDSFIRWASEKEQEHVLFMITKEFYTVQLRYQYTIERMLFAYNQWASIVPVVRRACDELRAEVFLAGSFEGLNERMASLHQHTLPAISKLRKNNLAQHLLKSTKAQFERLVVEHWRHPSTPNDVLRPQQFFSEAERCLLDSLAHWFVHVRRDTCHLPLEYLEHSMSHSGLARVRTMIFEYESKALADNALPQYISELYRCSARDFHVLHYLLLQLVDQQSLLEWPLSDRVADNQVRALRWRHRTAPMESLPAECGVVRFCRNCRRWARPTAVTDSKSHYCLTDCLEIFDVYTGELYCGRKNTSVTSRKTVERVIKMDLDREHMSASVARMIRRHNDHVNCEDQPLEAVQMVGKMKLLDGHFWVLCERCANLMELTRDRFDERGFSCGLCSTGPLTEKNALKQAQLERERDEAHFRCYYCNAKRRNRGQTSAFQRLTILNDLDDPRHPFFETVLLCPDDFKGVSAGAGVVVTKTTLMDTLKSRRERRAKGLSY
jgi:hypothetical protein